MKYGNPKLIFLKNTIHLSYDLLGHGKTPLKKSKVTFEDFSRQLLNLINELNFKKIHLVGFSLGALIARHFASKHNDRLCSLIIHGSIYKRTKNQKRVVINRFNVAKIEQTSFKKVSFKKMAYGRLYIKKNPKIYEKIYSMLRK